MCVLRLPGSQAVVLRRSTTQSLSGGVWTSRCLLPHSAGGITYMTESRPFYDVRARMFCRFLVFLDKREHIICSGAVLWFRCEHVGMFVLLDRSQLLHRIQVTQMSHLALQKCSLQAMKGDKQAGHLCHVRRRSQDPTAENSAAVTHQQCHTKFW